LIIGGGVGRWRPSVGGPAVELDAMKFPYDVSSRRVFAIGSIKPNTSEEFEAFVKTEQLAALRERLTVVLLSNGGNLIGGMKFRAFERHVARQYPKICPLMPR
jgi:hypothetical protein